MGIIRSVKTPSAQMERQENSGTMPAVFKDEPVSPCDRVPPDKNSLHRREGLTFAALPHSSLELSSSKAKLEIHQLVS